MLTLEISQIMSTKEGLESKLIRMSESLRNKFNLSLGEFINVQNTICEQLVGRVQRISPNKNDALIYDYIDNHGLTKNQFINYSGKPCRKAVYEKLGCIIK